MGSKTLLVLVLFLASVLLLSADQVASKDVDETFVRNDGMVDTKGVDDMKYYGGWGWRGRGWGWRGWYYCPYGCCGWNYYGGCWRCCYYPHEHVHARTNAVPHN